MEATRSTAAQSATQEHDGGTAQGAPKIYAALVGLMDEIGAIGKDSKNTQQNYQYRGIDAVMNALHPLLCKYRVITVPRVLEDKREQVPGRNGGVLLHSIVKVQYTLYAEDGSSVAAIVLGEGMDSGDKATNKALSVAYKYAMCQLLCIPTEEMVDPDSESPEVGMAQPPAKPPAAPKAATPAAQKTPEQLAREARQMRARQAEYQRDNPHQMADMQAARREAQKAQGKAPVCVGCHKAITPTERMTAQEIADWTRSQCNAILCPACFKAWKNETKGA